MTYKRLFVHEPYFLLSCLRFGTIASRFAVRFRARSCTKVSHFAVVSLGRTAVRNAEALPHREVRLKDQCCIAFFH